MARIRSVKPELRVSRTAAEWPREVRYAWVLLWGYLDDHGRGVDDLRTLKSDLFPLDDDVTGRKLDGWLDLMTRRTRWTRPDRDPPLCRYEVGTIAYLHAVYWQDHQRVSHPRDSGVPPCPFHNDDGTRREGFRNGSGTDPEEHPNGSGTAHEPSRSGSGPVPSRARGHTPAEQGAGSREQGAGRGGETSRDKRARRLPDDFDLDDARAETAARHGMSQQTAAAEFDKFTAWHGSKGSKHVDWDRAWLTWVLRWKEDHGPGGQHAARPEGSRYLANLRAVADDLPMEEAR